MPVTSCKLLRDGEYVENRLGNHVTKYYAVVYTGPETKANIVLGAETAGPPDANTPPNPVPAWNGDLDGLPIVERLCIKKSSGYAVVKVTASNATYYGTQPFDGRPRSTARTRFVPFRIPHVMVDTASNSSSIHYYDTQRAVSTRVYSATSSLTANEINAVLEEEAEKVFTFPPDRKSLFVGGEIRPYQNNRLLVNLVFEATASIPEFPENAFGSGSQLLPALGVLDDYYIAFPGITLFGIQFPPVIGVRSHTLRYRDGGSIEGHLGFNSIGFQF